MSCVDNLTAMWNVSKSARTDSAVRVVVAGYGNPLRGDDSAGWRVAEAIAERWSERVVVLAGHQPVPEWAAAFASADVAFIIDATFDATQGVRPRRLDANVAESLLDGHTFGPAQLLALTRSVYGRTPATYLVHVPAENAAFGEALSASTRRAVGSAVREIERRLKVLTGCDELTVCS